MDQVPINILKIGILDGLIHWELQFSRFCGGGPRTIALLGGINHVQMALILRERTEPVFGKTGTPAFGCLLQTPNDG